MAVTDGFTGAVGHTPLIRLKSVSEETGCEILGKAEFMNPGGSVKDRAAKWIVLDAERRGVLKPGGTVVEGTAGNTGIGLAHVCNARGYRCVIVMPDNQAAEKYQIIETLGAELRKVPAVPYSNPNQYQKVAGRLAAELPGAIWANQFDNTANRLAHFESTGPEIWNDTGGKIDAFCAATGTGGTLAGVAAYLKSMSPRHPHRAGRSAGQRALSLREGRRAQIRRRQLDHRGHRHRARHGESRRSAHRRCPAYLRCRDRALRLSAVARGRIAARKHGGHQCRGRGADSP